MNFYRCGAAGGGGGITLPTNFWHGDQNRYNAIEEKDPNTLYHLERPGVNNRNDTFAIYLGETQLFPIVEEGYDWCIYNLYFPNSNDTGCDNSDYEIDTGLCLENGNRDWQIEFKATLSNGSLSGDQVICGTGTNTILKECYFNTSGGLCLYGSGISDSQYVTNCSGHDMKFIFIRSENSLYIYKDGELADTRTGIGRPSTGYYLGISRYSSSYRFHGTIDYFKFKWLS